ncbi:paralemmin-3 isoform X2 [Pseudoliparis swirei]|uniref:paralemmin-3 isoform X2 n=1 Tax=Pseudoliparis swirei TaxID=2059687 RepID=UPI0024BD8AA1|nr:paralemmin-3 isoform X2 [Pseudoliparis swirei]
MDETEKYKRRLEAIAEKRRLQEDEDRARRDMEDEKLRLQQLKRKSLRDQWLMEGAPLSPKSQGAQSPRSPLLGSQPQEMEKHIDKLQSESQRLAEEEETLKQQMGDGQTEAGHTVEAEADEVKTKSTPLDETAAVLTNGGGDTDLDTHGPLEASGGGGMESEPWSSVSEAEPARVPHVNINEEEEEGTTLVMRAERVIITDEGDDVPEALAHMQETPQTEGGGDAEGQAKTDAETFTQPEKSEAPEPTGEEPSATGDGDSQGGVKKSEREDGERPSEGLDEDLEGPTSEQELPVALEGTAVASVPVYSEVQPFALEAEGEAAEGEAAEGEAAEGEAAASPEGAEGAVKAPGPAALPGQFQEVPLERRQRAEPGEREALLSRAKANDAPAKPAAAAAAASTGTYSATRAGQGEEAKAPEQKFCQCCSFM